jgi:hypothetical protein
MSSLRALCVVCDSLPQPSARQSGTIRAQPAAEIGSIVHTLGSYFGVTLGKAPF